MNNKNTRIKNIKGANKKEDGGLLEQVLPSNPGLAQGLSAAAGMIPGIFSNPSQTGNVADIESGINRQKLNIPSANTNASLMNEWANYGNLGHVSMSDVGAQSGGSMIGGALQSGLSGAASGVSMGGPVGALIGGGVGLLGSLTSGLFGRNKARRERDRLNKQIDEANRSAIDSFARRADTLDQQQGLSIASNYFQDGGLLHSHGAEFGNGLSFIGEGGSHEQNPFGGVQVGMDQEGNPNLLEEGESVFQNYVFSDSLKPDKETLKNVNIKESYSGKTFAEIAQALNKESEERPNDPISKAGFLDAMAKLTIAQEDYKMKNNLIEQDTQPNVFRTGGSKTTPQWGNYGWDVGAAHNRLMGNTFIDNFPQPQQGPEVVLESPIPVESRIPNENTPSQKRSGALIDNSQYLRYAPVLGSALSVAGDLFGWQNRRDYTHADTLRHTPVNVNPIGDYMTYTPLDRNYYTNQLRSAAAANRSAIANQSAGNRATATAGLLASDQNAIGQLGALGRQAEEFNLAQRMQVGDFNRRTNMFNTETGLRADMFNAEGEYRAASDRARMKQDIDSQISQARSANLTGLFDNLGEVGREALYRNMINTNPAWRYGVSGRGQVAFSGRNGGKLMTRF